MIRRKSAGLVARLLGHLAVLAAFTLCGFIIILARRNLEN